MWGKELVRCPVCKSILGKRDLEEYFIAHCDECQTTFHYKSNQRKPTSILDKTERKKCHCESCKSRGS